MSSIIPVPQPLSLHIRLLSFIITCAGVFESIVAICAITLIPSLSPSPPPLVTKTRRRITQVKSERFSVRSMESPTSSSTDISASEYCEPARVSEKLVLETPKCNPRKLSNPFLKFSLSSSAHPPSLSPFTRRLSLPGRRPPVTPLPSPLASSSYFTYRTPTPSPTFSSPTGAFRIAIESNVYARPSAGAINSEKHGIFVQKISKKARSMIRRRGTMKFTSW
ncbi:hypothetical protein BD779DRAFT_60772 [Infundibulicybe gibba]|nr:hypothetical protein BD779DRAFT_60772 [Infundibulicybe gibba]